MVLDLSFPQPLSEKKLLPFSLFFRSRKAVFTVINRLRTLKENIPPVNYVLVLPYSSRVD